MTSYNSTSGGMGETTNEQLAMKSNGLALQNLMSNYSRYQERVRTENTRINQEINEESSLIGQALRKEVEHVNQTLLTETMRLNGVRLQENDLPQSMMASSQQLFSPALNMDVRTASSLYNQNPYLNTSAAGSMAPYYQNDEQSVVNGTASFLDHKMLIEQLQQQASRTITSTQKENQPLNDSLLGMSSQRGNNKFEPLRRQSSATQAKTDERTSSSDNSSCTMNYSEHMMQQKSQRERVQAQKMQQEQLQRQQAQQEQLQRQQYQQAESQMQAQLSQQQQQQQFLMQQSQRDQLRQSEVDELMRQQSEELLQHQLSQQQMLHRHRTQQEQLQRLQQEPAARQVSPQDQLQGLKQEPVTRLQQKSVTRLQQEPGTRQVSSQEQLQSLHSEPVSRLQQKPVTRLQQEPGTRQVTSQAQLQRQLSQSFGIQQQMGSGHLQQHLSPRSAPQGFPPYEEELPRQPSMREQEQPVEISTPASPHIDDISPKTPSNKKKDIRYTNTMSALEKAGLLDVTLQTADLMKKNNTLQKDIDMLEEIVKVTRHLMHES